MPPPNALLRFLEENHGGYYAKLVELRTEVERWLTYVPATFPHYTQHTVEHSDEITNAISNVLFQDGSDEPCCALSGVEAYIVAASAYLHDIGMVLSEAEKREILTSEDWAAWLAENALARERVREVDTLHTSAGGDAVQHLIADYHLRLLVAEYARTTHHDRSVKVMRSEQANLGRFAYDDEHLLTAIENVCRSHGLSAVELEDPFTYPRQSLDIRNEKVDMRFLATLLRLGDLLDLRCVRACPLLLTAAAPLPRESVPHWFQYHRIRRMAVSPDNVLIHALCENQLEHRVLRDWCEWIRDETELATRLLASSDRHVDWRPPLVAIGVEEGVLIQPAPGAEYVDTSWKLRFDEKEVLDRFIHDVHGRGFGYVQELLQNCLDAMRCRMYVEMDRGAVARPAFPNEAPSEWLDRYKVTVRLTTQEQETALGGTEERSVLEIEDDGIGMTADVIERYFLQVGRSYYTSQDFQRQYSFVPTSRFGIGFLSVFSVAERVRVETRHVDAAADDAISLSLDGPRSYFLRNRIRRETPGTTVRIVLQERCEPRELESFLGELCRRVEFVVRLEFDNRDPIEITAETPQDFAAVVPTYQDDGSSFEVAAHPVGASGVAGEAYVFVLHVPGRHEDWTRHGWATHTYLNSHPSAEVPALPPSLYCVNGLSYRGGRFFGAPSSRDDISLRVDVRKDVQPRTVSRRPMDIAYGDERSSLDDELRAEIARVMTEHLQTVEAQRSEDTWRYLQRLMNLWGDHEFWASYPGTTRLVSGEEVSLAEIVDLDAIPISTEVGSHWGPDNRSPREEQVRDERVLFDARTILRLSDLSRHAIFSDRFIERVDLDEPRAVAYWTRRPTQRLGARAGPQLADAVAIEGRDDVFSVRMHRSTGNVYHHAVVNTICTYGRWLVDVHDACNNQQHGLHYEQWKRLWEVMVDPIWYSGLNLESAARFVEGWRTLDLPAELQAPDTTLEASMCLVELRT